MARGRGAEFVPVPGGPTDPAFVAQFAEIVRRAGAGSVEISFCGPQGLLDAIRARMREHAIPPANLRHEFFEFR
jgi:predicted ferric reductase